MRMIRLTPQTAGDFRARVQALAPDAQPGWGTLTPAGMLAHLNQSVRLSLAELDVADRSVPGVRGVIKFLVFDTTLLPWPKARVRAPAGLIAESGPFDEERDELLRRIDGFLETLDREPERRTIHPALGPIRLRDWSTIHGRHMDWHLKQFSL